MAIVKSDVNISIGGRDADTLNIHASYQRSAVVGNATMRDSVNVDIMAKVPATLKRQALAAVEALAAWVEANSNAD